MELTLRVAAQPAPVSHVPRAQPHSSFPKLPTLAASIGTGIVLSVQSLPALRGRVLLGCGLLRVFADSSSGVLRPFDLISPSKHELSQLPSKRRSVPQDEPLAERGSLRQWRGRSWTTLSRAGSRPTAGDSNRRLKSEILILYGSQSK